MTTSGGPPYDEADLEVLQRLTFRKVRPHRGGNSLVSWFVRGSRGGKDSSRTVAAADVEATKREVAEQTLVTSRRARDSPPKGGRASTEAVDVLHLVSYTEPAEQQHHSSRRAAAARAATAAAAQREQQQQQQRTITIGDKEIAVDALSAALHDPALCAQVGVAPQQHTDAARAVGENVRVMMATLTQQSRSEVGRKSTAVAIAAAVPSSSSTTTTSNAHLAQFLGVDAHLVATARKRRSSAMEAAAGGASATAALSAGQYFYETRKPMGAALPQEMEDVITQFWHTDDDCGGAARASGNTKEVKRESKSADATTHPVRHMHITGEEAYTRFLVFEPYVELRARLRRPDGTLRWKEGEHVSRSVVLSRRCWCIETVRHECAACTRAAQHHNADT